MITVGQVRKLQQICASTRELFIVRNDIKAVSVANRDSKRPGVIQILQDQKPLWSRDACNQGMAKWIAERAWFEVEKRTK